MPDSWRSAWLPSPVSRLPATIEWLAHRGRLTLIPTYNPPPSPAVSLSVTVLLVSDRGPRPIRRRAG
jgi:hypothetical protein